MFLDEAIVEFTSGRGGAGAVAFHREKHVPRGGPNGADGGKGGDIILVADRGKRTLYDFKFQHAYKAQNGEDAHSNKTGGNGADLIIKVPIGTLVTEVETGDLLADLAFEGARYTIAKGGRGGFGNDHYTSSSRQAPKFAQKGEPEETIQVKLELKLLADIGLIGLPNAGKSTLISRISAAKPKIANYPFTTIVPNLGVVSLDDESFVVADMPGLIEGASEGHGLGHQFLKHVERTAALVHVVECAPMDLSDPIENYKIIESELAKYSPELAKRPRIVVLSKTDTATDEEVQWLIGRFKDELGVEIMPISAATGQNIDPLMYQMLQTLRESQKNPAVPTLFPVAPRKDDEGFWDVVQLPDGMFQVIGKRIDKLIAMTDLDNEDAVKFLHSKLQRIGVIERLRERGAKDGDEVAAGNFIFTFEDRA
jgi:GTP-binding protein